MSDLSDFYEHFNSCHAQEELPLGTFHRTSNDARSPANFDGDWDSLFGPNATPIPRPISPYSAESAYSALIASPTTTVCDFDGLLGDKGADLQWLEVLAKAPPLQDFTLPRQTVPFGSVLQLEAPELEVVGDPVVEISQKKRKQSLEVESRDSAEEAARPHKKAKRSGEQESPESRSTTVIDSVEPTPNSSRDTTKPVVELSSQLPTARVSNLPSAPTSVVIPRRTRKNKRSLTRRRYKKILGGVRGATPPYICPECKSHGAAHQRSKRWEKYTLFLTHLKTHIYEEERVPSDWFTCIGLTWQEAKSRGLPVDTTGLVTEVTGEKRYFGCGKHYTKRESLLRHLNAAWCLEAQK